MIALFNTMPMQREVFEFFYGSAGVKIPYYTFSGSRPGPTLVLSGGMHGDEINGVSIMRQLIEHFQATDIENTLAGTIIAIPVLNPTGYGTMQRQTAFDGLDPNRCFGMRSKKSRTHFWAEAIVEKFYSHADYAIDFHDAGGRSVLLPHVRIHKCEADTCHHCTHEMAKYFDTQFIMERKGHKHMLAVHMFQTYNKPVLTVEIGGEQSLYQDVYKTALHGVTNILAKYGFTDQRPKILHEIQINIDKRVSHKAPFSGEIVLTHNLGTYIEKGQEMGYIIDILEDKRQTITAKTSGHLFSVRNSNQIIKGKTMYSILENTTIL